MCEEVWGGQPGWGRDWKAGVSGAPGDGPGPRVPGTAATWRLIYSSNYTGPILLSVSLMPSLHLKEQLINSSLMSADDITYTQ